MLEEIAEKPKPIEYRPLSTWGHSRSTFYESNSANRDRIPR